MKRTVALLLLLLWLASRAAAQADSASHAVAAAQAAAGEWLGLVDSPRYEESWDSAAALVREKVSKPDWKAAVQQARGPLEQFGARTLISASFTTTLPEAPPGQYVVLQYQTGVAEGRMVAETVTPMRDPDGRWGLGLLRAPPVSAIGSSAVPAGEAFPGCVARAQAAPLRIRPRRSSRRVAA